MYMWPLFGAHYHGEFPLRVTRVLCAFRALRAWHSGTFLFLMTIKHTERPITIKCAVPRGTGASARVRQDDIKAARGLWQHCMRTWEFLVNYVYSPTRGA